MVEATETRDRSKIQGNEPLSMQTFENTYCRRCGTQLTLQQGHVYTCQNSHTIFANASPAVALILVNQKGEIATLTRSIKPGKGKLDFPGGFCDGLEAVDAAVYREIEEEMGVASSQYSSLEFLNSGIDMYEFANELIPVVSIIFKATCSNDVTLTAGDDAETAEFLSIDQINRDDIFFESLKISYDKIYKELHHVK